MGPLHLSEMNLRFKSNTEVAVARGVITLGQSLWTSSLILLHWDLSFIPTATSFTPLQKRAQSCPFKPTYLPCCSCHSASPTNSLFAQRSSSLDSSECYHKQPFTASIPSCIPVLEPWGNSCLHCKKSLRISYSNEKGYMWTPSSPPPSATVSIIFFMTSACLKNRSGTVKIF